MLSIGIYFSQYQQQYRFVFKRRVFRITLRKNLIRFFPHTFNIHKFNERIENKPSFFSRIALFVFNETKAIKVIAPDKCSFDCATHSNENNNFSNSRNFEFINSRMLNVSSTVVYFVQNKAFVFNYDFHIL